MKVTDREIKQFVAGLSAEQKAQILAAHAGDWPDNCHLTDEGKLEVLAATEMQRRASSPAQPSEPRKPPPGFEPIPFNEVVIRGFAKEIREHVQLKIAPLLARIEELEQTQREIEDRKAKALDERIAALEKRADASVVRRNPTKVIVTRRDAENNLVAEVFGTDADGKQPNGSGTYDA